jgi:hypothetical protein
MEVINNHTSEQDMKSIGNPSLLSNHEFIFDSKMDQLPPEIVKQILAEVPESSLTSCRLACRSFEALSFPPVLPYAPMARLRDLHRSIISLTRDAYNRPAVMWSPWATGHDGFVDEVWMENGDGMGATDGNQSS